MNFSGKYLKPLFIFTTLNLLILAGFFYFPKTARMETSSITIEIVPPQCSDNLDNDGDNHIDYPNDPDCDSPNDLTESPPPPTPAPTPSPIPTPTPTPPPSGGGGYYPLPTIVNFTGRAYPKSTVTLLKDAQIAATTVAGNDAAFQISISGLSAGAYLFSMYSEDNKARRSSLLTFPVSVTAGVTTNISGIFIAPTIDIDKSEVKRGDNISIFGQSAPQSDIVIMVSSDEEFFAKTVSDKDGVYLHNFDTSVLDYGSHYAKSKASIGNLISGFGYAVNFKVGTKTITKTEIAKILKGDLNNDGKVNLVDFSIAAYWHKRPLSESFKKIEMERLSGDGKINLIDFSIMAYYWTG